MEDPGGDLYRIGLMVFLLGCSALFSGSETALFSLGQVRSRQLVERKVRYADLITGLQQQAQDLLGTLLLGNTMVNIVLASVVTGLSVSIWGDTRLAEILATAISTVLLLTFGEITPKAIAAHNPETFSLSVAPLVSFLVRLSKPVVRLLSLANPVTHQEEQEEEPSVTEESIKTALTVGEEEGGLAPQQSQMIHSIFAMSDEPVSKAMVPMPQIVSMSAGTTIREAAQMVREWGYTRYPVLDPQNNHPLGILHAKDLLSSLKNGQWQARIDQLLRPLPLFKANLSIRQLLNDMRQDGLQMSMLQNDRGEAIGLITIEDLIEEIVGEIDDEYDREELAVGSGEDR